MAFGKKPASLSKSAKTSPVSKAVASTPMRNSALPPRAAVIPAARKTIAREQIAIRAYEIWRSGGGGSDSDNWHRAERELRGV